MNKTCVSTFPYVRFENFNATADAAVAADDTSTERGVILDDSPAAQDNSLTELRGSRHLHALLAVCVLLRVRVTAVLEELCVRNEGKDPPSHDITTYEVVTPRILYSRCIFVLAKSRQSK